MRTTILITALVLLLAANFLMMYVTPFGLTGLDGFADASGNKLRGMMVQGFADASGNKIPKGLVLGFVDASGSVMKGKRKEGFETYTLANGGGAGDAYHAIGAFDGVRLKTGNSSSWRYTAPNEPLQGPEFTPGPDDLFIFKNNQCKPECCGSSFSCDGGCVCTTPQQRDYINQRGGNRTLPDDSV